MIDCIQSINDWPWDAGPGAPPVSACPRRLSWEAQPGGRSQAPHHDATASAVWTKVATGDRRQGVPAFAVSTAGEAPDVFDDVVVIAGPAVATSSHSNHRNLNAKTPLTDGPASGVDDAMAEGSPRSAALTCLTTNKHLQSSVIIRMRSYAERGLCWSHTALGENYNAHTALTHSGS